MKLSNSCNERAAPIATLVVGVNYEVSVGDALALGRVVKAAFQAGLAGSPGGGGVTGGGGLVGLIGDGWDVPLFGAALSPPSLVVVVVVARDGASAPGSDNVSLSDSVVSVSCNISPSCRSNCISSSDTTSSSLRKLSATLAISVALI